MSIASMQSNYAKKSCCSSIIPNVPLKLAMVSFSVSFSSMFQYGYASSYINTAQINFMIYLNQSATTRYHADLSENAFSWIWSAIVNCDQVGFVLGTLMVPFFAERYGRKWTLIASIAPETLGTCVAALAMPLMMPSILGVGRIITAIGVGVSCSAVTLFLQEVSPTNVRGFISSFQEFATCISCVAGMVMGLPVCLGGTNGLPYLVASGLVGTGFRLVLLICPDTPKFLLLRKRQLKRTCESIKFYHGREANVQSVLLELEKEGKLESVESSAKTSGKGSKIRKLWTDKHVRKAVVLGTVVYLAIEATGIIPVYEYSTYILEDAGLKPASAEMGTLLMAICNTVSTFLSLLIIERFGRRTLFLGGLVGVITCLSSFAVFDILYQQLQVSWAGYGAMISVIMHAMIFSLGPGPISWFVTSELVPQHMRSTVQAFTQLWNMTANLTVSFIFFPAFSAIGGYAFIFLCIVPTILCTLYLYFELPETKNREVADIVMELQLEQNEQIIAPYEKPDRVEKH